MPEHQQVQQFTESKSNAQKQVTTASSTHASNPYFIIQRAKINPKSLTHSDIMQLQRTIGNQAVGRLLSSIGNSSTAQQATVQHKEILEEEEPLQSKMAETIKKQEIPESEESPLQGKFENKPEKEVCPSCSPSPIQRETENRTGMPDNLKAGVESLSGIDMSDVRVHYNSSKPADVGALAYTQGMEIHVASGQEKHLPHEAWHVVQQAQGRVRPTMQLKGVAVNDDVGLEREADVMGLKASTALSPYYYQIQKKQQPSKAHNSINVPISNDIIQRETIINYGSGTVPETMMEEGIGDYVLNLDSGHMMLSQLLCDLLKEKQSENFGSLWDEILEIFPFSSKEKNVDEIWKSVVEPFWIKHGLFERYPGREGVSTILSKLPQKVQDYFTRMETELQGNRKYERGDERSLGHFYKDVDKIYCINGYGYFPLQDSNIYIPMARALKDKGLLIIISSAMGPTVKPAVRNLTRAQIKNRKVAGAIIDIGSLGIDDYFGLQNYSISIRDDQYSDNDPRTKSLETRHTEGESKITDLVQVRLELVKIRHPE